MNRLIDYIRDVYHAIRRPVLNFRLPNLLTFDFWWNILTFPFHWFFENWQGQRSRHLLLGLPAAIVLIIVGSILGQAHLKSKGTAGTYWQQAQAVMNSKDYAEAELLLTRILQEDTAHQGDARFAWLWFITKPAMSIAQSHCSVFWLRKANTAFATLIDD